MSEFHGIDAQGYIKIEKLDTLPSFEAGRDKRRMVLVGNTVYCGGETEWREFGVAGEVQASNSDQLEGKVIGEDDNNIWLGTTIKDQISTETQNAIDQIPSDERISKVSTTSGDISNSDFLENKILPGTLVNFEMLSTQNYGKVIRINATPPDVETEDPTVKVSSTDSVSNFLNDKIIAGKNIGLGIITNSQGEQTLKISNTQEIGDLSDNFVALYKDSEPDTDVAWDIGSSSKRWKYIYAGEFRGTALQAQYADIAEVYTSKEQYPLGTIVAVSNNEKFDVEIFDPSFDDIFFTQVAGVVSENPGIIINSESNGIPITLKGKTKVWVEGSVEKGDKIVPLKKGYAKNINNFEINKNEKINLLNISIGSALETKTTEGIDLVDCFVSFK